MADHSSIEWTDATWNPVTGCTKVSPGCDYCYAERITNRFGGRGAFGQVQLHADRLRLPTRWGKPKRIFVCSMGDLFHEAVPDEFIARVFAVMSRARQHTYQILTKRPGRMRSLLSRPAFPRHLSPWPLPNVWLGVSAETQHWADIRIPVLMETPAAVRFVSAEPLLGPADLTAYLGTGRGFRDERTGLIPEPAPADQLGWVIAGGESGPGARPMHPDWPRSLRDQCVMAAVPFFFKQWGEWAPSGYVAIRDRPVPGSVLVGGPVTDAGHRIEMRRQGKKHAGRLLDRRIWSEFPQMPLEFPQAVPAEVADHG